jgi:hypothetical protein
MAAPISWRDVRFCATNNNRRIILASSGTFAETGRAVYFITSVEGSGVKIKDAAGVDILTVDATRQWEPGEFRIDGGIGIENTGGKSAEIMFFTVPVIAL